MRVLLIAYMRLHVGVDFIMKIPNLGLTSIAANVDREICDVKVADLLVAGRNTRKYFQKLLREYKPDIVGFSAITMDFFEALELARVAKESDPKVRIVMGGYHPTLDYEVIMENDYESAIDFLIRGEAEVAFDKLIRALNYGTDLSEVPNLSYRDDGDIVHNPAHDLLNLDEINLPDRSARIIKKGYHIFGYPADIVEMSRGCPFSCSFCSSPAMYGRTYRKFGTERILADLRDAQNHGAKAIFVTDHNVTGEPKWYKEVCEAIIDAGLNNLRYSVQASIRGIKQVHGLAETMARSGVKVVLFGIESVYSENMDFMQKDQFAATAVMAIVNEFRQHNVTVLGTFILGSPDDTENTIRANYEYARKIGVDIASFLTLTPYPNTPVRKELLKQNLITNLHDYSKYDTWETNIKTKHLSTEQISKLRKECDDKYIFESGSVWRLIGRYPTYAVRLILSELCRHPGETLGRLRRFSGKPIGNG